MRIGLFSFRYDSGNPYITRNFPDWLIEGARKYERQEGALPDLMVSAGFTCADPASLKALEREFSHKPISLAVEMLDPADHPLIGSRSFKGRGQFYVVGNGRCLELGPRQQFTSTGNISEAAAEKVIEGLGLDGGRRFSVQEKQVGWLECGEMNVLRCPQHHSTKSVLVRYEALQRRFYEAVASLDVVVNPQHTRMSRLHLLRRKAEAISSGLFVHAPAKKKWPVYCGVANWDSMRQIKSQSNLQYIFRDGQKMQPRDIAETEDWIFSVYHVSR